MLENKGLSVEKMGLDHRFGYFFEIALWCPFGNRT
jgi:hypothetical protein